MSGARLDADADSVRPHAGPPPIALFKRTRAGPGRGRIGSPGPESGSGIGRLLERVALGEETLALQDLAIQDASSRAVKPVPADALGAPATIVVEAGRQTLDLELRRLGISEDY
jgi:hypothetical protein